MHISNNVRIRGKRAKMVKNRSRLDLRKKIQSQVINDWNSLPEVVVEGESINSFKNRYDKFVSG